MSDLPADHGVIMAIWEKIATYNTIILHRHIMPDYDALGSAFGLREIIQARWPEKKVYVAGGDTAKFDLVPASDALTDDAWNGALAIVCDCSSVQRIDDNRFQKADFIIKIDHHQDFSPFGDLYWVDTTKVATAEMIALLFQEGRQSYQLTLPGDACIYLYSGLVTDSNRFQFVTAAQAPCFFSCMNLLLQEGRLSPQEIIQRIYLTDEAELRFIGYLKENFERPIPEVAYMKVDNNVLQRFNISWEEARGRSNSLMGIRGVRVWALFVEDPDRERILCEFRSIGPVINEFAHRHGGGGHRLASGCEAGDWEQVTRMIAELCEIAVK